MEVYVFFLSYTGHLLISSSNKTVKMSFWNLTTILHHYSDFRRQAKKIR